MTESLIHLRVSAARKGRWVRASRAAGMRLSGWGIHAVEAQMQQLTRLAIHDEIHFAIPVRGMLEVLKRRLSAST